MILFAASLAQFSLHSNIFLIFQFHGLQQFYSNQINLALNKLILYKIMRTSKSPIKNSQKSVSPSNKSRKSNTQIKSRKSTCTQQSDQQPQQLLQKMKRNRDKLCHNMDTYTLLIQTHTPLRCLQHNSSISLYCQTEQKLLCANCVFGNNIHRLHKVVPIQKATKSIQNDICQMKRHVQRQIKAIQSAQSILQDSFKQQDIQVEKCLRLITDAYASARQKLVQAQEKTKKDLIMLVQGLRVKHQTVLLEMGFIKKIYTQNQFSQLTENKDSQLAVYQHLTLSALKSQGKFDGTKWISPKNQVKKLAEKQLNGIKEIRNYIIKHLIQVKHQEAQQSE